MIVALQMRSGTNSICDPYPSHLGCISNVSGRTLERTDRKGHSQDRMGLEQGSQVSVRMEVTCPSHS